MKIARLYNQHGAFCREWKGSPHLDAYSNGPFVVLRGGPTDSVKDPIIATLLLNGHSLVIEEEIKEGMEE